MLCFQRKWTSSQTVLSLLLFLFWERFKIFFSSTMTDCLQKCKTYRNGSEGKDLHVLPRGAWAGQYFSYHELYMWVSIREHPCLSVFHFRLFHYIIVAFLTFSYIIICTLQHLMSKVYMLIFIYWTVLNNFNACYIWYNYWIVCGGEKES